jgi:hypothetical protein
MKTFDEVLDQFSQEGGRLVYRFGETVPIFAEGRNEPVEGPRYQLELEPLIAGGYLIALYENQEEEPYPVLLLPEKVPVRPILRGDGECAVCLTTEESQAIVRVRDLLRSVLEGVEARKKRRKGARG